MNDTPKKFARDFRADARAALKNNWGIAILVTFLAGLLGGQSNAPTINLELPSDMTLAEFEQFDWSASIEEMLPSLSQMLMILIPVLLSALVFSLALLLIGPCIHFGLCRFRLALLDGDKPSVGLLFSGFKNMFFKALGVRLMQSLIVFLVMFASVAVMVIAVTALMLLMPDLTAQYTIAIASLCVLCGLIAAIVALVVLYRYAMSFYALVDNPAMGVMDALRESKRMMKGNKWRLFCLQLSFIGWSLVCLFTCGVGYFWLGPYMGQAEAAFYHDVSGRASVREAVLGLGEFMEGL